MVKITLGDKGQRMKSNFYFFGIVLALGLGSCVVCTRYIDWSSFSRSELEKSLLEVEEKILLERPPEHIRFRKLWSECGRWLRARWLVGFLAETGKQGSFCGRPNPAFWDAVEAQRDAIIAGKPFDEKKIPRYRMTVEFTKLNCRLIVGEASTEYRDIIEQKEDRGY